MKKNDDDKSWHAAHMNHRKKCDENYRKAEAAHIAGLMGEANLSPLFAAAKYTVARSRNPSRTRCGWYDDDFEIFPGPSPVRTSFEHFSDVNHSDALNANTGTG